MAGKKNMWITAQKEREQKLRERKWALVRQLASEGLSYGDIQFIIRIDRGGAYRIVKSKPVTGS